MHLEDAVIFVPYGCMVDEFQHIIYDNPNLTPDERKQVWKKLEQEYKPHLDYQGLEFFKKAASGRNSIIFTVIHCTTLIMSLHSSVLLNTRYGWIKTARQHGKAI